MNSHILHDSARLKEVLFWAVSIVIELLCIWGIVYSGSIATVLMLITVAGLSVGDTEVFALFPIEHLLVMLGCLWVLFIVFEHQLSHYKKWRNH